VKYQAVIFDLGGTLTYGLAWSVYVDTAKEVAAVIKAPADDFVRIWFELSDGLGTGVFPSFQDFIKNICRQLTMEIPDKIVDLAAGMSITTAKRHLNMPREGAIEVISFLKSSGYKTALISDCAPDVPEVWQETPFAPYFDVTVFSCNVGMNKADPRIFQIALEKLAVKPEQCMYIADGMRNELSNAKKLGMHAVQIIVPGEDYESPIREEWNGQTISSLKEVLDLLSEI
jgi:putative hydrolase of the HAD superfamily